MLRLLVVLTIIAVGACFALRSPFYALLFYLWNAYFRPETWVWNQDLVLSFRLSYAIAIFLIVSSVVTRQRFRFDFQTALLGLMLLHSFLSALYSEHFEWSWGYWVEFSKVLVITYFIIVLTTDEKRFRYLLLTIAFSLGLEGARQGWSELIRNPGSPNDNPIPFLGDNNGVAIGMLMLVPIFAALAQTSPRRWMGALHRFLLVGVLYRAISTYSRGAFVACLALGSVYWWRSRRKGMVLVGLVVAAGVVLPVMPASFWDRMESITEFRERGDKSALGRLHFWSVAVDMAAEHPILGVGFNGYNESYDDYDTSKGEFGTGRSVHSSWFGALAELGFPGFALYVVVVILSLRNCRIVRRAARTTDGLGRLGAYALAIETGLIAFLVGATFLPSQYNEMGWHFFGMSIVLRRLAGGPEVKPRRSRRGRRRAGSAKEVAYAS